MKTIFNKYVNNINGIIKSNTKNFSELHGTDTTNLSEGLLYRTSSSDKALVDIDFSDLIAVFGENPHRFNRISVGSHPDFKELGHEQFIQHFSVSMFVDIKGSTKLSGKYSLHKIRQLKDTILTLCIYIAHFFGGHVQRLQGDGIFIHFVRKNQHKNDAIINALNAGSLLCYFIKTEVAAIFTTEGIQPLKIRVGIDYGSNDDVIWSYYGIPGCSELTTTSLHTDLAAKLQAQADSNGIMIGDNIRKELDLNPEYIDNIYKADNSVDYYIFQGHINYRKYKFNWSKYLKTFTFFKTASNGSDLELFDNHLKIKCVISDADNTNQKEYYQNLASIPKGKLIKYAIIENGRPYNRKSFETIEWRAFNNGTEAKTENVLQHDFGGKFKNLVYCETTAAYLGHHYVECLIKRQYPPNIRITFPIFVQ